MRRAALIYNPASGTQPNHRASVIRAAVIEDAMAVLRKAGVEAEAVATTAPGSAAEQVAESVRNGCDTIIACGGDGTVHEVLQSVACSNTVLGVLPLGTANALAQDLGLPLSPVKAAQRLLESQAVRVSAGRISFRDQQGATCTRYFTVAAGIGADAQLMYRLDAQLKRRFGYALYAVEGLRILATHPFPLFEAAFTTSHGKKPKVEAVSQLLAVRIRNFGGMLQNFAPGATLTRADLRLVAFKTRSRWDYMRFLAAVLGRRQTFKGKIELLDALSVECRPLNGSTERMFVEADGELLGGLPVRIDIVPDALTLLIPLTTEPKAY
jgi:diacylglycerol kinase (ATP)